MGPPESRWSAVTVERKHFNPYEHWFSGIVTEIAVFAVLIAVLAGATMFAGLWGR